MYAPIVLQIEKLSISALLISSMICAYSAVSMPIESLDRKPNVIYDVIPEILDQDKMLVVRQKFAPKDFGTFKVGLKESGSLPFKIYKH